MAAKIPGPENAPQPGSFNTGGPSIVVDRSGLARGIQEAGAGVTRLGRGVQEQVSYQQGQQNVVDVSTAEADYTKRLIDLKNGLATNNDYNALPNLADDGSRQALEAAAESIRDPKMKASWLAKTEVDRLKFVDGFNDRAVSLKQGEDLAKLNTSIDAQGTMATDPTLAPADRQKAFDSGIASLELAKSTGLMTPGDYITARDAFIKKAQQGLSINVYSAMAKENPAQAIADLNASLTGGAGAVPSQMAAASGGTVQLSPDMAAAAAKSLRDASLPREPELQAAYLSDPKVNQLYVTEALSIETRKLGGDTQAAIIALAPGGSEELAKQFAKSGHDVSVLPKPVRDYYQKISNSIAPGPMSLMPIVADPNINLTQVQKPVLQLWEGVQSTFGKQLPITSGARDAEHNAEVGGAKGSQHLNGNAIDVDWSTLNDMERERFIETASAMGFTGIGVYKDHVHLDLGARRAWGPDQKSISSAPADLQPILSQHSSGKIEQLPPPNMNVAPAARWLTYDQRLQLSDMAKQERDRQSINLKASIETTVNDAPAAVAATGQWDGPVLRPNDFVEAYGGAEGVDRYRAYSAAMDVAKQQFGFKTSSNQEIALAIQNARPRSTGPGAEVEAKRYATLLEAGNAVIEARNKDPVAYSQSAFPVVAKAWSDAASDPSKLSDAISWTSAAERQMGLDHPKLLPKSMADSIKATWDNEQAPQSDRVNAISQVIAAAKTEDDRTAIWQQLVDAGIPGYLGRAFAAQEESATDPSREGDAKFLFMAGSLKSSELPQNLSSTEAQINDAIGQQFAPGSVGSVIYNLGPAATSDNQARANEDAKLFKNAVSLHMAQGMNLTQAVAETTKEMWGNVKVVTGNGAANKAGFMITIPKSADPNVYQQGFTKLLPEVGHALMDQWDGLIAQQPVEDGSRAVGLSVRDNYIRDVLQSGYFASIGAGHGYVFINPKKGTYVPDHYGRPLIFTEQEVTSAGQNVSGPNLALPPGNQNITPERLRQLYGSNFDRPAQ